MSITLALLATVAMLAGSASAQRGDDKFRALFDGKSLDGWVQRGGQDDFAVIDGCIVGTNRVGTGNGFLCTVEEFGDFELELDFFCPDKTNSGIQIRSQVKKRERRKDTVWGYQVEIDPSARAWTGGIQEELGRGWIANLKDNPKARAAFVHDAWNHFRIVANGDRMRTWINGVPAADLRDTKTARGFIGLQLHWPVTKRGALPGTKVRWKNIRIRTLDRSDARPRRQRPNVVVLFTDDQGTLDANCYGSTDLRTPHIDALARTGVRFTQAYSHTVCCPARAALLTGRHPQRSGVTNWTQGDMFGKQGINMALNEVTLAEALRSAGYRTALFGKWHLGAHRDFGPKKQGFDEFFGIRDGFIDNYNHFFLHGKGFHDLYEGTERVDAPGEYFPELMVKRSLAFLEQNKDRAFFLYVPFNIPHYPEQALAQFEAIYKDVPDPARRSYAAIVSTTDHYIGQIVAKLEALGLRDDTIVIYMSDNGHSEETSNRIRADQHTSGHPKGHFYGASGGGNTGKWIGCKGTFLEGGVRVPAIISYPSRLPRGVVRDQIVTAMDWYPTVLALCGVTPNVNAPKLDGHNLLPVIQSQDATSGYGGVLHFAWRGKWAVRDGEWKLRGTDGKKKAALHRLTGDDPEKVDLAQERPDIVKRLQVLHDDWARSVKPR